jgi:hypothetical protein
MIEVKHNASLSVIIDQNYSSKVALGTNNIAQLRTAGVGGDFRGIGRRGLYENAAVSLPRLRREFQLHGSVKSARIYITSHGLYELFLNGVRLGDQLLTPGWTPVRRIHEVVAKRIFKTPAGDTVVVSAKTWWLDSLKGFGSDWNRRDPPACGSSRPRRQLRARALMLESRTARPEVEFDYN